MVEPVGSSRHEPIKRQRCRRSPGQCRRRLLGQIVPDAALDEAMFIAAREFAGVCTGRRMRRAVRVAFERNRRYGLWLDLALGNARHISWLKIREGPMSGKPALVLAMLCSLVLPGQAFAQFAPPAGSAGAGPSAISGVPYGPANPRSLSDPSGIGNASSLPPLRSNAPVPVVTSTPTAPLRTFTPRSYPGSSQQIISTYAVEPRRKAPPRRRGRPQVSSFTGICRGC